MSEFDPGRIAMILAQAPGSGAEGQAHDEVATGYFLTGDLVLTARHVAGDEDRRFRVRAEVGGSESDRWADATPAWKGRDVDAMLLRTTRSFGSWQPPGFPDVAGGSGSWKSSGYAKAAEDQEARNRKTLPIDGSFDMSYGQGPPELRLQTSQHIASEHEHYWKGISGAPIFSKEEGGGLVGIITDASKPLSNGLIGLSAARLLEDIHFQSTIARPSIPPLPTIPWCLVLTAVSSRPDLESQVAGVFTGFREKDPLFQRMHPDPVVRSVLWAVESVEHWAATVEALARADFVIADVSNFEPAVMALLGIRSVLRRGVTISVTRGDLDDPPPVPFNVQETKVLSYDDRFYSNLHRAMTEGHRNLIMDSNYLDLPAYHAVRAPRPVMWAEEDPESLLVLCPFGPEYRGFYEKALQELIQGNTHDKKPQRMLDLRTPRLVGQALYEQIRWASRCIVDWTGWRPNVFFELGVRLACSEHDPLCIIDRSDLPPQEPGPGGLEQQRARLSYLFEPVAYDRGKPHAALSKVLQSWVVAQQVGGPTRRAHGAVPPAGTFEIAQANFGWRQEAMLEPPHVLERKAVERMLGRDQELRPEPLTLFGGNQEFNDQLEAAVREKWIAAWLYLRHLGSAEACPEDLRTELRVVSRLAERALKQSPDPRHERLLEEIGKFLKAQRAQQRTPEGGA